MLKPEINSMSTNRYGTILMDILVESLYTTAVPRIQQYVVDKIIEKYDAELLGKSPLEDPTAPENIRKDFIEAITRSIEDSLVVSKNAISFSVIDKSVLGYNGVSDPLSTLVFYLEGFLEEYAFIPKKVIVSRFGSDASLGRYKKGYLVSKKTFTKNGWDKKVSWDSVSLKYAKEEGIDIFDIDLSDVDGIILNVISESIKKFSNKVK